MPACLLHRSSHATWLLHGRALQSALPKHSTDQNAQETLPNGLKLFVLEDHEVPLVRGSLLLKGGQHASPADKVGLASITATVQRAGGSIQHPATQLNDRYGGCLGQLVVNGLAHCNLLTMLSWLQLLRGIKAQSC